MIFDKLSLRSLADRYTPYPHMKLGEIYRTDFDDRPFRIIGLDEHEVFYDCMWEQGQWTFSGNFRGKSIYYRMSVELFGTKSQLIDFQELTTEEHRFFRPELPMRFGRTKQLNWNHFDPSLNQDSKEVGTDKIVLVPYGPNGGHKRGTAIELKPTLTVKEVTTKARELQEAVNNQQSQGIGFYRLGTQRGIPSYAIGEYLDKAGTMKQ